MAEFCTCLSLLGHLIIITISIYRHMAVMIILAFCTCLSFCGVFIAKYDTGTFFDPETNTTTYRRVLTSFYVANSEAVEFVFQTFNLVVPAITTIVVIVATSVIAVRMRVVNAWREQNASVSGIYSLLLVETVEAFVLAM